MKIDYAYTQSCVIVRTDDNNTYVRHDATSWEWVVGMATETIKDPTRLEEAYQLYLNESDV